MRSAGTGSRFRARKLNTKTALSIVREADIADPATASAHTPTSNGGTSTPKDAQHPSSNLANGVAAEIENRTDDAFQNSLPKVESGVESKEEREHHLQQVIHASQAAAIGGKVSQISIPTPDAVPSDINYERVYPRTFVQPATYIRSSATVEDSTGVAYCMNDEDDQWLIKFNDKKQPAQKCSEDEFEELMNSFEDTTAQKQPFAAVDNTPVLSLNELTAAFDETVSDGAKNHASAVYEYWKQRRAECGNLSLMPKLKTLKMESGQEADDSDPYVCFRRREVRQARKTRGRDAQVLEKLKKLRRELEEARQIVYFVKQREMQHREDLLLSKKIFEQRTAVREMKRTLNIQDDDEDLITQRTPKRPRVDPSQAPSGARSGVPGVRPSWSKPGEAGVPSSETEITFLRDIQAKQEREVARQIQKKIEQHEEWNVRHIDWTEDVLRGLMDAGDVFLSPDARPDLGSQFVGIRAISDGSAPLPTPPPSNPSTSDDEESAEQSSDQSFRFRAQRSTDKDDFMHQAHIRLRGGRNGRVYLDRHNMKMLSPDRSSRNEVDERLVDRYKYDQDDGDVDSDDDMGHMRERQQFAIRTRWFQEERERELANEARARERMAQRQRAASSGVQPSNVGPAPGVHRKS